MKDEKDLESGPGHCAARPSDGRSGDARPPGPDSRSVQAPTFDTFDAAYQRGWNARSRGAAISANPYSSADWPELFVAWASGWRARDRS